MTDLKLRHYAASQAQDIFEELVELYLQVYADTDDPFFGEGRYRRQLSGHLAAPGFELVAGSQADQLVSYAYGYTLHADGRWWQWLLTPVAPEMITETGDRTFGLCEIMTLPALQGQGLGHAVHDELLAGRPEERATLLVESDNPAHALYQRWGWDVIGRFRPGGWEGAPTYDAMILPAREKQAIQRQAPDTWNA
jgi:GNAT superfamily N-acetyltransferase